jgi:hypothetical protein
MITKKTAASACVGCLISAPLFFAIGWFAARREPVERPVTPEDMRSAPFPSLGASLSDHAPMQPPVALQRTALNLAALKVAHDAQPKVPSPPALQPLTSPAPPPEKNAGMP